jgi:MYXO-CTERM domain-containing protein
VKQSTYRYFVVAIAAAACVSLLPARAAATPNFPGEVANHLMLDYLPACTLCHNGSPSVTTATTLFAESLRADGAQPNDTASLDAALDKLAKDMTDSDGDGTPDITELKNGTDPNTAGTADGPAIAYGCFAKAELAGQSSAPWGGAALTALCLAFAVRRRRR